MDLKSLVGTNYYVLIPEGNEFKLIHIGKGAHGYSFIFRWNPKLYTDFDSLKKYLKDHQIYNHFGRRVHCDSLMEYINNKRGEKLIKYDLKKVGKGDLVHIMEEEDTQVIKVKKRRKEKKYHVKHQFVDDDFGVPVSEIELRK